MQVIENLLIKELIGIDMLVGCPLAVVGHPLLTPGRGVIDQEWHMAGFVWVDVPSDAIIHPGSDLQAARIFAGRIRHVLDPALEPSLGLAIHFFVRYALDRACRCRAPVCRVHGP